MNEACFQTQSPLDSGCRVHGTDEVAGSPTRFCREGGDRESIRPHGATALDTHRGRGRVVAVINQKGGVGKTTTVINVASQLGLRGYKILVVDADSQGNCATGLGR